MEAFKDGTCAQCHKTIAKGESFEWGANRGDRVHPGCKVAPEVKPYVPVQRDWSPYQTAVFEWGRTGTGNAIINAVAGSGKTTVLEELARQFPSDQQGRYLVFAKANAVEAETRMPANVEASTFHSAGFAAVRAKLPKAKVQTNKMWVLFKSLQEIGEIDPQEAEDFGPVIQKLVGLGKKQGIGILLPDTDEEWTRLIDQFELVFAYDEDDYDIDFDPYVRVIEVSRMLLEASNNRLDIIDFDDMQYLSILLHAPFRKFDFVLVDETQDTDPVQRAMLHQMVRPEGRLVAVGDRRQSIFGFRSGATESMDIVKSEWGATELPLSINYRCSTAVVDAAKAYCPELEAWSGAPTGSVKTLDLIRLEDFQPTDAILCRVNAPLITLAYRFIGRGIRAQVKGRDIGQGLVALVKKMEGKGKKKTLTIDQLTVKLADYAEREIARWMVKGAEGKAQGIADKVESINAVIESLPVDVQTIPELIDHIENLFTDNGEGSILLSSVHKAKGLEWKRVFILDRERMPSKWAKQEWMQVQENNLIYVAMTRAREDLFFIKGTDIR